MTVGVKSVREKPLQNDGLRVLLERRWPAGLAKAAARIDLWLPQLALSPGLAKMAGSLTSAELQNRYFLQLREEEAAQPLKQLYAAAARRKSVTLLHTKKRSESSAAELLRSLLDGSRKPPTGSGPVAAAAGARTRSIRRR